MRKSLKPIPKRIYAKLLSGTYLSHKRVHIRNFTDLVDLLCWEQFPSESGAIEVHSLDYALADSLKDVTEKAGFQLLSRDLLIENIRRNSHGDVQKYYFYNFVIYTKAALDSMACTLNSFFNLGFVRGQIDFNKGSFTGRLENFQSFKDFRARYGKWIDYITTYRDAIIHRKSVELYPEVRTRRVKIPVQAFSHEELCAMEDSLETDERRKADLERSIRPISVRKFVEENVEKNLEIMGDTSKEVLRELRKRYPNHSPSTLYYG